MFKSFNSRYDMTIDGARYRVIETPNGWEAIVTYRDHSKYRWGGDGHRIDKDGVAFFCECSAAEPCMFHSVFADRIASITFATKEKAELAICKFILLGGEIEFVRLRWVETVEHSDGN